MLLIIGALGYIGSALIIFLIIGGISFAIKAYKKTYQGQAIIRTGAGGTKVSFGGLFVIPVIHKQEVMDITVKTMVINRTGKDGLVCKDNLRADIQVAFFVRVNKTVDDVKRVAEAIGCKRASDQKAIEQLFDAKFSEALKTVGKHFEFTELYDSRAQFNERIQQEIGRDLNGYVLEDCAIDYLEQTPLASLDSSNILDAEGIKKITQITSTEKIKANLIQKEEEKTITKQNVEARETVLELEKQLAESEAKQRREVETIKAREQAEIDKVQEEETQKSELARISAAEEVAVADENKMRQVIVAQKNKERTEAIETERVEKDRALEQTERERIVELANIEKEKALEVERKNIQDVIRERVIVEKAVVEEQEKIKDTEAFAGAEREKSVALTLAAKEAEENLVKEIKKAEAQKQASEFAAKQTIIEAEAAQQASTKQAEAMKTIADAKAAEVAAAGLGEAQVIEATAEAMAKKGESDAKIIELKAIAEAKGDYERGESEAKVIQLIAQADEEKGMVEAKISHEKYSAEAKGIEEKAAAMKKLDGVGREHEEFKLELEKETTIELAQINIQREIAEAQASVIAEALKAANIDIVGGETMFFDQIVGAITKGKSVDRMLDNSEVLTQVKDTFFGTAEGKTFASNMRGFIDKFGLSTEEIQNLSISNLLNNMSAKSESNETKNILGSLLNISNVVGISNETIGSLGIFK